MLTFGFRDLLPVCLKTVLFQNCVYKKQRSSAIYPHKDPTLFGCPKVDWNDYTSMVSFYGEAM